MNQGNKKNKIAIVGHTRGIGKAIADLYRKKNYTVVGLSSSNGYDLQCSQIEIMEQLDECQLIVLNAYVGRGQMTLLKRIYGKFVFEIEYIEQLQQELMNKPLSVYDICPDVVDTDMTKGLWEDLPKLKADEVAEAVRYCFESTFNVNKIVMQKNVS